MTAKNVSQDLGAINMGEMREMFLDGKPGKHHYSGRVTCVVEGAPQDHARSTSTRWWAGS